MSKILAIIFIFFSFFASTSAFEDFKIISREEWWANENLRYWNSTEVQNFLAEKKKNASKIDYKPTAAEIESAKLKKEKRSAMNKILSDNYYDDIN